MGRYHIRCVLEQSDVTRIAYVGDPSPAVYAAMVGIFEGAGLELLPNEPDLERLLVNSAQIRTAVRLLRSGEQGGMQHD
jgi:hypothetical protein